MKYDESIVHLIDHVLPAGYEYQISSSCVAGEKLGLLKKAILLSIAQSLNPPERIPQKTSHFIGTNKFRGEAILYPLQEITSLNPSDQ
ncbi:MAG: hypothetical protein WC728_12015 [Elusimicrobiota bacterium]